MKFHFVFSLCSHPQFQQLLTGTWCGPKLQSQMVKAQKTKSASFKSILTKYLTSLHRIYPAGSLQLPSVNRHLNIVEGFVSLIDPW